MSQSTLLIRLSGPLQSWGARDRYLIRRTETYPSMSGVIGLVRRCMGLSREDPITCEPELEMSVRIDSGGTLLNDFHTIGGGRVPAWNISSGGMTKGRAEYSVIQTNGSFKGDAILSEKHYLCGAEFIAALSGATEQCRDFLRRAESAIKNTVRPPFLGRMSCPPSLPLWIPPASLFAGIGAIEALSSVPVRRVCLNLKWYQEPEEEKKLIVLKHSSSESGFPVRDVPLSFSRRLFGVRHLEYTDVTVPVELKGAGQDE